MYEIFSYIELTFEGALSSELHGASMLPGINVNMARQLRGLRIPRQDVHLLFATPD